jgi:hypothetical protein
MTLTFSAGASLGVRSPAARALGARRRTSITALSGRPQSVLVEEPGLQDCFDGFGWNRSFLFAAAFHSLVLSGAA